MTCAEMTSTEDDEEHKSSRQSVPSEHVHA